MSRSVPLRRCGRRDGYVDHIHILALSHQPGTAAAFIVVAVCFLGSWNAGGRLLVWLGRHWRSPARRPAAPRPLTRGYRETFLGHRRVKGDRPAPVEIGLTE